MRKRIIDPEFWSDEKIALLSLGSRLLFIGIWNHADDEGLIRFNSPYLKSSIFPYDDIDLKTIDGYMNELVVNNFIFPYTGGLTHQKYAYVINFRKHQTINRPQPSKIPAPSIQSPQVQKMYAQRDGYICHICNEICETVGRIDLPKSKLPSVDHIVPRSKGGSDYPSNIKTAHLSCNKSRGNSSITYSVNDSVNDSSLIEVNIREVNIREDKTLTNVKGASTISENLVEKKEYGDPNVNQILEKFKTTIGLTVLDGTNKDNRQYTYLLYKKFGLEASLAVIDSLAVETAWWHGKITSMEKLYRNALAIMNEARGGSYGSRKVVIDPSQFQSN